MVAAVQARARAFVWSPCDKMWVFVYFLTEGQSLPSKRARERERELEREGERDRETEGIRCNGGKRTMVQGV